MKYCTTLLVILSILMVSPLRAAQEEQKTQRRPSLTKQPIRSEERLYRKAPEGNLFLHLYFPPGWKKDDSRPAIVFFFGGGWAKGTYQQFVPQAKYFASRGLVTASADYRIRTQHGTTPDKSVEDAKSAIRWVRSHAQELGIDPDKIIAAGGSAGGHLAASTALVDSFNAPEDDVKVSCRPSALVLFNPALNLTNLPNPKLVAQTSQRIQREISPTLYLNSSAPPTILFYGTDDKYLPQGEEYAAKAKELDAPAELYLAPGVEHGFFNRSPWTEATAHKADEFLVSLGYLEGKPTIEIPPDTPPLKKQ